MYIIYEPGEARWCCTAAAAAAAAAVPLLLLYCTDGFEIPRKRGSESESSLVVLRMAAHIRTHAQHRL